jgi:hypothetical protein
MLLNSKVTRLGEFLLIGRLFSFGNFLKIMELSTKIWATLFHSSGFKLIMTKNGLGYNNWGNFLLGPML